MTRYTIDWGKLAVLVSTIVATTVLGLAHILDPDAVRTILALAVGYTAGNGNLARKGQTPAPLVGPSEQHHRRMEVLAAEVVQALTPAPPSVPDFAEPATDGRVDGGVHGPAAAPVRSHPSAWSGRKVPTWGAPGGVA